jgi:hypothetical protein
MNTVAQKVPILQTLLAKEERNNPSYYWTG